MTRGRSSSSRAECFAAPTRRWQGIPLAIGIVNDAEAVAARVAEIAAIEDPEDGVEYLAASIAAQVIRDHALYHGVRVVMDARIATAVVKLRLDVNFGDPVTPEPEHVALPGLRPDSPPIHVLGYPVETCLGREAHHCDRSRRGQHPGPRPR